MDGVDYLDGSGRLLLIEATLFTVFAVWPVELLSAPLRSREGNRNNDGFEKDQYQQPEATPGRHGV